MKKVSPKAVGGFVVGAVLLAVVAVIVFGSGRIFQDRDTYVAFFTDSLQGLRVGAPVQFRGVQIGTVTEIVVQFDTEKLDFVIPVLVEIDPNAVQEIGDVEVDEVDGLPLLIEKGLRAQLAVQSFVTGQQVVQLFMRPNTPVEIVKTELPYEQIPTIPSTFAQVERSVGEVLGDISEILDRLNDFLGDNSDEIKQSMASFTETAEDAKATMADLRKAAADVATITATVRENRGQISNVVDNTNETLASFKSLAEQAEAVVAENREGLTEAIAGLRRAEEQMSEVLQTADALLNENRPGVSDFTNDGLYEIKNLAIDAQAAVEQFRRVMEELERDPARFLLGQPGQVEVK